MDPPSTSHSASTSFSEKTFKLPENDEPRRSYGLNEPVVVEFLNKYSNTSTSICSIDIHSDGALGHEFFISESESLREHIATPPDPSDVALRILLVKELSAEALQIMSTGLGIHLGFWAWVASDQASDGFWLNTNNNGKILSFDLPGFEFFRSDKAPRPRVVREGRLKQLSSRHRLYESGLISNTGDYGVFINRRVSGYLIPMNGMHTFVFFSEDCQASSSFPLRAAHNTDPVSTVFLIDLLKESEQSQRVRFAEEPLGIIMAVITNLLRTWHVLTVHIQRDLENIDATLPESLPQELPEHNLYDVGSYLQRDIVQTLFRFIQQLSKFEGYLKYLCNSTKPQFRPDLFVHDVELCFNNVADLRRRLDVLKERGNMSLALINNYIALQQARQASQMTKLQIQDSRSSRRLSVVATIFLPLSFASVCMFIVGCQRIVHDGGTSSQSWLSTNGSTPIWVFVPVAAVSVIATTIVVGLLKWQESDSKARSARHGNIISRLGRYGSVIRQGAMAKHNGNEVTHKKFDEYV